MRLLYISGFHGVLEYDELRLFTELGIDWFSTGVYMNPKEPIPFLNLRKPIDYTVDSKYQDLLLKCNPNYKKSFVGLSRPKVVVSEELLKDFDLVISTDSSSIINNYKLLINKPVIWRTVGSTDFSKEREISKLKDKMNLHVVRFSPHELIRQDSIQGPVIRPYVDSGVYTDWTGNIKECLTFQSWFKERVGMPCNKLYLQLKHQLTYPMRLYGDYIGNKHIASSGKVDWETQKRLYRNHRTYMYLNSPPSVPTYSFIEAAMTGTPLVGFGKNISGLEHPNIKGEKLYEPEEIIENNVNGFLTDNLEELSSKIAELMENDELAKRYSVNIRETAFYTFNKSIALAKWEDLFQQILRKK